MAVVCHCVNSPTTRVLWNGESTEAFSLSRRVRQGDPLSPYLFVLCIERLSQLFSFMVEQKLWKPIRLSRNGLLLYPLCFADTIILFGEASIDQAHMTKHICQSEIWPWGEYHSRD